MPYQDLKISDTVCPLLPHRLHTFPVSTTTQHSRISILVILAHATPTYPHIHHAVITDFRNWKVWHLGGLQWHNMQEKFYKTGQQVKGYNAHTNMCMDIELQFLKNSYLHGADASQGSLRNPSFTEPEVSVCIYKSVPTVTSLSQIYPPHTATTPIIWSPFSCYSPVYKQASW